VNSAKHSIDELKELLDRKKEGKEDMIEGEGEAEAVDVIDEEEFAWLSQLKAAKQRYRTSFDELRELKSDVEHISGLVENSRSQLLADFEQWMSVEHPDAASAEAAALEEHTPDDVTTEFEALEAERVMTRDPDSLPYFRASKNHRALKRR